MMIARAIKSLKDSLEFGPYTIYQPKINCSRFVAKKDLDFIVVPGLAFDNKGFRLGRGGGFYDRFLAGLSEKSHTVGVCFNFQIVPSVPRTSKDLAVKQVVSA